ncbi:MAG: hypothetical protein OEU78_00595, partial [Gammaproteobacteria bacterium]|nr:hypothetical protein [Gammaproteobacteria bacterium]
MNINRSSFYYLGREVVLSLAILICLAYLQPAQAAGPITNGDSPTDTIDFDGEIDTWTFSANSGDGIRVNIGATDRVNFTPLIRLYDPGSTQVASNQGTFSADITWQAAQSGTYTVEVLDSSGTPNGTATYTLYLATIPGSFIIPAGDEGGEPKNGGVVNPGSIDLGDMDLWTYPADAGDTLLIHVGEINGTGLGPELVLYSPDGVELGSSNSTDATVLDHPAAVAGTYTVVVQDRAADVTGSGDYELYFAGIPGDAYSVPGPGDEGGALTNGGVHAGSITVGDLDLWTFEADVQDTLRIQVGEITGTNFSPELVLYGPDGSELGTNKGSASTDLDHQATVAGT